LSLPMSANAPLRLNTPRAHPGEPGRAPLVNAAGWQARWVLEYRGGPMRRLGFAELARTTPFSYPGY
jgi:hypothetical protein